MRTFRLVALIAVLVAISALAFQIFRLEKAKQVLKRDYVELSSAKYGLFNVDEWKGIAEEIIRARIQEFEMDSVDHEIMRERISTFLNSAITDFENRYYQDRKGLKGVLEGAVASMTRIFDAMKKDVPVFTEQILRFMAVKENRQNLQQFVVSKIDEYMDETFAEVDYSLHDSLIEKYGGTDRLESLQIMGSQLDDLEHQERPFTRAILALAMIAILLGIFLKRPRPWEYALLIVVSLCLLIPGVTLPMIDLDARIAQLSFQLLGEPVSFQDQVMYFRSKSILQLVQLMLQQHKTDLILVGLLVLTFSVLFPVMKLLAALLYLVRPGVRNSSVIRFLVFRTAKWSMADVMVVAIFMAYIGFSGIISEQMRHIANISVNVEVLTTNQTCLQIGFYLFIAFAVLSLIISHRMQYNLKPSE